MRQSIAASHRSRTLPKTIIDRSLMEAQAIKIPVTFIPWPGALDGRSAAAFLNIGTTKLWLLANLDDNDPRKIHKTSYGTYPISELERHLRAELNA